MKYPLRLEKLLLADDTVQKSIDTVVNKLFDELNIIADEYTHRIGLSPLSPLSQNNDVFPNSLVLSTAIRYVVLEVNKHNCVQQAIHNYLTSHRS